jgi:hypothetical protein
MEHPARLCQVGGLVLVLHKGRAVAWDPAVELDEAVTAPR